MTKKKKRVSILLAVMAAAGVGLWLKNPNLRSWKNANGDKVDLADYPMKWSFFNNEISVNGRDDLKGIWVGNKLTWGAGNFWTC